MFVQLKLKLWDEEAAPPGVQTAHYTREETDVVQTKSTFQMTRWFWFRLDLFPPECTQSVVLNKRSFYRNIFLDILT